jgi:oxygen-independent coproporphyrinogen-3 oxidase
MDRVLDKNKVINMIDYCKEIGINDINVDLIYALPNEDINILKEDIDFILDLDITHISTYSLIIEEHTIIYINKVKNISEDLDSEMYKYICNRLKDNGFIHYEISNFCKAGYESKHNLCYWKNLEYYGFGLGASSYISNERIENTRSYTKYIEKNWVKGKELLSDKDKIEYEIMLNLRMSSGIDLDLFYQKYQKELKDFYDYQNLVNDKLLCLEENHLFIPENKWYISNEIIVRLLEREVYE